MIASTQIEMSMEGFGALADPTRLVILRLLQTGTRCVCHIQEDLPHVAPNLLSHHLRVLREANLVISVKRGRWVDYTLNASTLEALRQSIPLPIVGSAKPTSR